MMTQSSLNPTKLVFIDETSTNTKMTRAYGRCPTNQRLIGRQPFGHWKTTTFIAGLRCDAITAPFVLDGAMDRDAFLVYLDQVLGPTLSPGDIVIMDNLATHKGDAVRDLIHAKGATLMYLPPYSPDLNPIELAFAKLKTLLRKAGERTVGGLWDRIGSVLDAFTPQECANYLKHDGYAAT
jgi:transposase